MAEEVIIPFHRHCQATVCSASGEDGSGKTWYKINELSTTLTSLPQNWVNEYFKPNYDITDDLASILKLINVNSLTISRMKPVYSVSFIDLQGSQIGNTYIPDPQGNIQPKLGRIVNLSIDGQTLSFHTLVGDTFYENREEYNENLSIRLPKKELRVTQGGNLLGIANVVMESDLNIEIPIPPDISGKMDLVKQGIGGFNRTATPGNVTEFISNGQVGDSGHRIYEGNPNIPLDDDIVTFKYLRHSPCLIDGRIYSSVRLKERDSVQTKPNPPFVEEPVFTSNETPAVIYEVQNDSQVVITSFDASNNATGCGFRCVIVNPDVPNVDNDEELFSCELFSSQDIVYPFSVMAKKGTKFRFRFFQMNYNNTVSSETGSDRIASATKEAITWQSSGWVPVVREYKLFYSDSKFNFNEQNNNTVVVVFDFNTGDRQSDIKIINKGTRLRTQMPLPPGRIGYDFVGWFGSNNIQLDEEKPINSNAKYYARWSPNRCNIQFIVDGNNVKTISQNYDGYLNEFPQEPTKQGYSFIGWYDSDNNRASLRTKVTGNVVYYARFSANSCCITWDSEYPGGGSISNIYDYDSYITELPTMARTGYTLIGWYDDADNKVTTSTRISGNATYHAKWQIKTYTIVWNSNGGSAVSSWTRQYGTAYGTLPTTTRGGYNFLGWFTEATGGSQVGTNWYVYDTPDGIIPYYAHWSAIPTQVQAPTPAQPQWHVRRLGDLDNNSLIAVGGLSDLSICWNDCGKIIKMERPRENFKYIYYPESTISDEKRKVTITVEVTPHGTIGQGLSGQLVIGNYVYSNPSINLIPSNGKYWVKFSYGKGNLLTTSVNGDKLVCTINLYFSDQHYCSREDPLPNSMYDYYWMRNQPLYFGLVGYDQSERTTGGIQTRDKWKITVDISEFY